MFGIQSITKVVFFIILLFSLSGCDKGSDNTQTTPSNTTSTYVDTNRLKNLILSIDKSTLEKNENISVNVVAIYDNNTSKDVTDNVEWIINPKGAVIISQKMLVAKKDKPTTIKVKFGNMFSNSIHLDITWVLNGYILPPEPDNALNNSTLLGIDLNNNGVRDDVERKIVIKYVKPIEIELMLSYAKTHQEMLNDPTGSAIESEKKMSRVIDCRMYLKHQGIRVNNIIDFTENNMYNTKKRVKSYLNFNQVLSGGVYGSGPADWNAQACDFDVEKMLKNRK